jgi:hypothetical protein
MATRTCPSCSGPLEVMKAELVGGPHDGEVIDLEQFMVEDRCVAMNSQGGRGELCRIRTYEMTGRRTRGGYVEMLAGDATVCSHPLGDDGLPWEFSAP